VSKCILTNANQLAVSFLGPAEGPLDVADMESNPDDQSSWLDVKKRLEKSRKRMKLPKLTAVIEKEGKWYVSTCPELGVASQGRSFEEAEAMIC